MSVTLDLLIMDDWMVSAVAQQLRPALSARTDEESEAKTEKQLDILSVIKAKIRKI